MRHRKSFNHLRRKAGHRKAMLANMASSLIKHKRITTTKAKAKALRGYVEPLITKSKDDTTHSRRVVFGYLQDKDAVTELFREVSPKILERPGGYTRILKLDNRPGDNAEMAMIELVDFNENLITETKTKEGSSRRRRRGGSKKKSEPTATADTATVDTVESDETVAEADEQIAEAPAPEEVKAEKQEDTTAAETEAKSEESVAEEKTEATTEDTIKDSQEATKVAEEKEVKEEPRKDEKSAKAEDSSEKPSDNEENKEEKKDS